MDNSIFRRLDMSLLKHFYDVATYGGFSKASRATGISQPALSLGVQKLEKALQTRLFARGGRDLSLTDQGRELLQFCKRFESGLESIVENFGQEPVQKRVIRIGTALSVGFGPLLTLCQRTLESGRPIDIEMTADNTFELMKAVSGSELDAALLPSDVYDAALELKLIHQDNITFVVGKGWEKLLRGTDWREQIGDLNLITYPRETPMRSTIDRLLRENNLHFRRTFSVNSMEAMKAMVTRNLGGAFILRSLVQSEIKSGTMVELKRSSLKLKSGVVLATRKDERGNEIAALIGHYLQNLRT